uniref:Uncharacterized protein n=1 Tax=Arundo donax TaxID=35708 RepID=A0A0A9FL78_ARUDO
MRPSNTGTYISLQICRLSAHKHMDWGSSSNTRFKCRA